MLGLAVIKTKVINKYVVTLCQVNPCKPGVLSVGHRQTVKSFAYNIFYQNLNENEKITPNNTKTENELPRPYFFCGSFMFFLSCVCDAFVGSVYMCLVVTS